MKALHFQLCDNLIPIDKIGIFLFIILLSELTQCSIAVI